MALGHEPLQMVAGNQFVMNCCPGEMDVVSAQAHELLLARQLRDGQKVMFV